jgi:membrane associated rhomboid family serine protease
LLNVATANWSNVTSLLVCLAYLLYFVLPLDWAAEHLGFISGPAAPWTNLYRMFTYTLVHANFAHVFFNMLLFFPAGLYVEKRIGSYRAGLLWAASAIGSAYFHKILSFGQAGVMIGASGSVSAFMAAALMILMRRGNYAAPVLLASLILNDCAGTVFYTMGLTNVAHWGHIGGMVTAFCFMPFLLAKKK